MRIEKAIRILLEKHEEANGRKEVRDKVAWALYQTWKEAEDERVLREGCKGD